MELFTNLYAMAALGVCILFHILCAILPDTAARILNYVNIGVHAASVVAFAFFGLKIEEAVLLYLISIFVYSLAQYIRYNVTVKKAAASAAAEAATEADTTAAEPIEAETREAEPTAEPATEADTTEGTATDTVQETEGSV
jgi:hypothetical protein